MKLLLNFSELTRYIADHYGKSLVFSKVADNELCVAYEQNILIRTIHIPVNIRIDEVKPASILLTYKGSFGLDMIISGALVFIKSKLPELSEVIVPADGNRLNVELSQLQQAKTMLEKVALEKISVHDDGIEIEVTLK